MARARFTSAISAAQGRNGPCGPPSAALAIQRGGQRFRWSDEVVDFSREEVYEAPYSLADTASSLAPGQFPRGAKGRAG